MKVVVSELNWPEGMEMLKKEGKVVYDPHLWKNRRQLFTELAEAQAIIVRNQTQVDAQLLDHAPEIKVIGRLGVGLDNIDLTECRKREIDVIYAKNANAISVAEYVLAALFTVNRRLIQATEDVQQGNWNRKAFTGYEIYGRTLGLIGVGEIGVRIATRARALGMHVVGCDPFVAPYDFAYAEAGIENVSQDELLYQSDFISVHVPLTRKTRHLISQAQLAMMKKKAVIINTSRGGVIDEQALTVYLRDHPEACAVLDVLEEEPPGRHHPFMDMDNVILTPHVAGLTEQSQQRTSILVAEEVVKILNGMSSICKVEG